MCIYIHACIISQWQCYELIYYSCIFHNCRFTLIFPPMFIYMCLSVCFNDRLPDRHSCLNFYPCVIKVQSVNQSINLWVSRSHRAEWSA